MKIIFLSFVALALTSCASTELKPGAEAVVVSDDPPPASCKEIGFVESDTKINIANASKNLLLNLVRNRAYELGGNYVKLDVKTTLNHSGPVYKCP